MSVRNFGPEANTFFLPIYLQNSEKVAENASLVIIGPLNIYIFYGPKHMFYVPLFRPGPLSVTIKFQHLLE